MGRTKPGSRSHRYVQIIGVEAEELGRGLEMDEIREAYREHEGESAPDCITSEISSLNRRGVLEATGGRPGRTRYAPADLDLPEAPSDEPHDDTLVVLEAVRRGWERRGWALSTAEVAEEIGRGDRELRSDHPDTVRKRLETLSRRTERGPEEFREPKVRRLEAISTLGQSSNHWVPAHVDAPPSELIAPRSRADAVRQLVYRCEEDLGRPPSRRELRWWLESPRAPEPIRSVLDPNELGTRLADTGTAHEGHTSEVGRLQPVESSLSCHGGPPRRWTLHEVSEREQALCELEATLHAYRVPEEIRSLRGLQNRADRQGGTVLPDLVDMRRRLLLNSLREAAGDFDATQLLGQLEEAYSVLQERVENTDGLSDDVRSDRRCWLRERLEAVRSTQGALQFIDAPDGAASLNRAGESGTVRLEKLGPVLGTVADVVGLEESQARQVVAEVRRFPGSEKPGRDRIGPGPSGSLSALDRVDAYQAVFELFSVPRARSLITEAQQLLGHVLRDPSYVENLLDQLGTSRSPQRAALIVALGLLGEAPEFSRVIVDAGDIDTVRAWVLATILAEWTEVESRLEKALHRVERAARRAIETAVRRVRAGYLPSAID